ncbi:MAG: Zn-ribbon domain-containing protein [Nanoarchaeota archaeon]|nr:Zn-ribbon domain-containing protein [Nanoarchaeota archaeon]
MPHQCVRCSKIISSGSRELLDGCSECKGKFFFYVRDEQLEKLKEKTIEIPEEDKIKIEEDVREIAGIENDDLPVILDFESVRATGEGKFELDLVNLFNTKRPLVYKIDEGKYLIDLARTLQKFPIDDSFKDK